MAALAELAPFSKIALEESLGKPQANTEIRKILQAGLGQTTTPPCAGCNITVGAEDGSSIINVAIQFVDGDGNDMQERTWFQYYVSEDAAGDTVASDPGTVAIGTDGTIIKEHTDDVYGTAITEADGDVDFNITVAGALSRYLQILLPNGKKKASGIMTWAA